MDGSDDCRGCVDGSTLDRPSICLRTGGRQRFHSDAGLHDRTLVGNDPAVACANVAFFNEIEDKTPPDACETGGPDPAHTKDELVAYLRSSFEYGSTVLRRLTPANALDPADGRYGGPSTRLGLTTLAIWHASDHYGQIVIYLRMNGVVPSASR